MGSELTLIPGGGKGGWGKVGWVSSVLCVSVSSVVK